MNNKTKATLFMCVGVITFIAIGLMQTTQTQIMTATMAIIEFQLAIAIDKEVKYDNIRRTT